MLVCCRCLDSPASQDSQGFPVCAYCAKAIPLEDAVMRRLASQMDTAERGEDLWTEAWCGPTGVQFAIGHWKGKDGLRAHLVELGVIEEDCKSVAVRY